MHLLFLLQPKNIAQLVEASAVLVLFQVLLQPLQHCLIVPQRSTRLHNASASQDLFYCLMPRQHHGIDAFATFHPPWIWQYFSQTLYVWANEDCIPANAMFHGRNKDDRLSPDTVLNLLKNILSPLGNTERKKTTFLFSAAPH